MKMPVKGGILDNHSRTIASSLAVFVAILAALSHNRRLPRLAAVDWDRLLSNIDWGNVIAALLAVGGYLLQHWSERNAARLDKQIERVEAQSHAFLVPITTQFHSLLNCSTLSFVDRHVGGVLPEEDRAAATASAERLYARFSTVFERPTELRNPASWAMMTGIMNAEVSPKASSWGTVLRATSKTELPPPLHDAIAGSDRSSELWRRYEAFVRNEFFPGVEEIARIISEHGHLMIPVPARRLEELFGGRGNGYGTLWSHTPRMWFYSKWLSYARSWKALLSLWDAGVYDDIRPCVDFPVGLLMFNVEAQTIAGNVEKKLIGVSQMHGYDI